MGGGSKSSSSSQTTNQDNRVGAEGEAVAIGAGATVDVNIDNESPEVFPLLEQFLEQTGSALDKAIGLAASSREAEAAATAKVIDVADKSRGITADALKMLAPVAVIAAIAWGLRGSK